jgi:saccharopine dehydrogenase-like NADP-dependent oxidoreductase
MQIGIVGAGIQGGACAHILAQEPSTEKIILIDKDEMKLVPFHYNSDSNKIHTLVADANEVNSISDALVGCDVCIDMLLPEYAVKVMKAALDRNINYVNTAYEEPFWTNIKNGQSLYLNEQFKEKGLTALLGCGNSPGLVNVYVKKYSDKLDKIEYIKIYGAYKEQKTDIFKGWNPGWSIKQAYIDFITPPCIFRNGEFVELSPFSEIEERHFIDYGIRKFAAHSHEENFSVPHVIKKGIRGCEFKYEIDQYAAIFYSCGFKKNTSIIINGEHIDMIDAFLKVLTENITSESKDSVESINEYSTLLYIDGYINGSRKEYTVALPPLNHNKRYVIEKFGTLNIDVALPAIVGMKCLTDAPSGIIFAENIETKKFTNELNRYIQYEEVLLN